MLSLLLLFSLPLLLVGVDIAIDKRDAFLAWGSPQWSVWCTGFLWDLSAWTGLVLLLAFLSRAKRRSTRIAGFALLGASAFIHSLAIAISAGYHAVFHHLPNIHALEFAINEWRNAWGMFLDAFDLRAVLWFALSIPLFVWLHRSAMRRWSVALDLPHPWLRRMALAFPFILAASVSSFALGWHRFQEPLPLGAAWSRTFFQYGLQAFGNRTDLQRPVRMEIQPPTRPTAPFNILVILHESLRADALSIPGIPMMDQIDAREVAARSLRWQADSLTLDIPPAAAPTPRPRRFRFPVGPRACLRGEPPTDSTAPPPSSTRRTQPDAGRFLSPPRIGTGGISTNSSSDRLSTRPRIAPPSTRRG